jgi:hypothetical protein
MNQLRSKYAKNGITPLKGDTLVPMDDPTPQSPNMKKGPNGEVIINIQ